MDPVTIIAIISAVVTAVSYAVKAGTNSKLKAADKNATFLDIYYKNKK